jgi:hypothetical protein
VNLKTSGNSFLKLLIEIGCARAYVIICLRNIKDYE